MARRKDLRQSSIDTFEDELATLLMGMM